MREPARPNGATVTRGISVLPGVPRLPRLATLDEHSLSVTAPLGQIIGLIGHQAAAAEPVRLRHRMGPGDVSRAHRNCTAPVAARHAVPVLTIIARPAGYALA